MNNEQLVQILIGLEKRLANLEWELTIIKNQIMPVYLERDTFKRNVTCKTGEEND